MLRGALAAADVDPIIAEYEKRIYRWAAELLAAGKISKFYADEHLELNRVNFYVDFCIVHFYEYFF